MSYDVGSSDDDFYDARQEFGSPKCPSSPLLFITDDDDDSSLHDETRNLNSPNKEGGDLLLDHLITPDNEDVIVHTEASEKQDSQQINQQVSQQRKTTEETSHAEPNKFESIHMNIMKTMEQHLEDENSVPETPQTSLDVTDGAPPPITYPQIDLEPQVDVSFDVKSSKCKINHEDNVTPPVVITTDQVNDVSGNEKESTENISKKEIETPPITKPQQQQPDVVVSAKERPSNLPGVTPMIILKDENMSSNKRLEQSQPVHGRPKRPPPPRPKNPPKRPPLPRATPTTTTMKPYLSSIDGGLLTPNSTVDSITKEFVAVLAEENPKVVSDASDASEILKSKVTSENAKTNSEEMPQLLKTSGSGDKIETYNATSSFPHKPSAGRTSTSHIDEEQGWSEMTKSTVLRIDSSPGLEILSTVIVRNLDTGQTMPLSAAAEQVSQCLNPLALQIMSRTKEFNCASGAPEEKQPLAPTPPIPDFNHVKSAPVEEDTLSAASDDITIGAEASSGKSFHDGNRKLRGTRKRFKHMIGKSARRMKEAAVQKVKLSRGDGQSDSLNFSSEEEISDSLASTSVKTKVSSSNKGPYHFTHPRLVQDIAVHVGAVWSMKFSHCGRLLATAGQNNVIWVWVLKEYFAFFNELRNKYNSKERGMVFATPPRNSMEPPNASESKHHIRQSSNSSGTTYGDSDQLDEDEEAPFKSLPFSSYVGHTGDVLDLAWSKNHFTLSSSMDKTVRLWHVSQKECLCCFQHIDFVTAISFHPRDDRYFLSGSLDSKLRLWNIPEKKVALWNEVAPDSSSSSSSAGGGALITTVNFCENGKFAVCGTYDGRCLFYDTEHFKYHTQIHVRSSRGRNTKGHKITGIEPLPGEHKILVTSNDSRVRLYDLRDLSLTCKFRGLTNLSSQIKASFSHDSKYIVCGSEDKSLYIWNTNPPQDVAKLSSFRRDRNDCWECIRAHDAVVTCAIFAPYPHLMVKSGSRSEDRSRSFSVSSSRKTATNMENSVIISADFNGVIKVFCNP